MKSILSLTVLIAALAFVGLKLRPPADDGSYSITAFGRLPVLANGRIKPLDTVARSSLLQLQNRQRVSTPEMSQPFVASPVEWLLDVCFHGEKADRYPTFVVDDPQLLALIGKTDDDIRIKYASAAKKVLSVVGFLPSRHRRFSFQDLAQHLSAIENQARLAQSVDAGARNSYQSAVLQLYGNLLHYQRLKYAFIMPGRPNYLGELLQFQDTVDDGIAAIRAKQAGQPYDPAAISAVTEIGERFVVMANTTTFLVIPPDDPSADPDAWKSTGAALLETFQHGQVDPVAFAYAGIGHSWQRKQPEHFNELVKRLRAALDKRYERQLAKTDKEVRFNASAPFYTSMTLYGFAFLFAVGSLLVMPETLRKSALWLVAVAWLVATAGILTRMWLEGRPPVTNLYSSALYVGWAGVAISLILELFFRNGIALIAASAKGFATLIIAHNLSFGGDTLEMMRAVLDSNFWLGTHVVVVTTGYSATFLAGFLGIIYIVLGVFTRAIDKEVSQALTRMVYGIICFATLFSFTGTILGGIWADQSWGRFWGWDPKENGALIIVVWNAIILHARWGGMIKSRGLMCMAVFGNVVTSWSWFGTNLLGVGLHNYGFHDGTFWVLVIFVLTQFAIMALTLVPAEKWRSFRTASSPEAPLQA